MQVIPFHCVCFSNGALFGDDCLCYSVSASVLLNFTLLLCILGIPADVFLRNFQELLSSHPTLSNTITNKEEVDLDDVFETKTDRKLKRQGKFFESASDRSQTDMPDFGNAIDKEGILRKERRCTDDNFDLFKLPRNDDNVGQCMTSRVGMETRASAAIAHPTDKPSVLELLKFIDDEEEQASDTESSNSKMLLVEESGASGHK